MKYVELIIEGSVQLVRGFVHGVVYGKELKSTVMWNDEHRIKLSSLGDFVKEWIIHQGNVCHLVLDESAADAVAIAVNSLEETLNVEIKSRKTIEKASFNLRIHTFTVISNCS